AWSPSHPNARGNLVRLVLEEVRRCIFQSIAIGVLELKHITVVAEREQPSIRRISETIDVVQIQRQLADRESGHQYLDRWRIAYGDERSFRQLHQLRGAGAQTEHVACEKDSHGPGCVS